VIKHRAGQNLPFQSNGGRVVVEASSGEVPYDGERWIVEYIAQPAIPVRAVFKDFNNPCL